MTKSQDNKKLRLAQLALWNCENIIPLSDLIKMTGVIQGFKRYDLK